MPITAITIENFKGIKGPVKIELKPITLLFGPNSAGKSTVIQALHYAREIFERENINAGHTLVGGNAIDLGGFKALVHRHDTDLPIIIRFDLDLNDDDLPRYLQSYEDFSQSRWEESPLWDVPGRVKSAWVEIAVGWSDMRNKPLLKKYSVGANGEGLATIQTSDDGRQIFISQIDPLHPIFLEGISRKEAMEIVQGMFNSSDRTDDDHEGLGQFFPIFLAVMDTSKGGIPGMTRPLTIEQQNSALPIWGSPLVIERSLFSEDVDFETEGNFAQVLSSLLVGPGELVRDALRKLRYIGPLRTIPPRSFDPSLTPDETRWANGLAAWDTLFKAEEFFIDQVNDWLDSESRLNCGYRVEIKEYKELNMDDPMTLSMLQDNILDEEGSLALHLMQLPSRRRLVLLEKANGIEVQPYDIGVGISQVLPVIVAALFASNGFVIVEQPELHVHPGLQVALGDLFVEQTGKHTDLTFLLETHSEHLMLRFLRRIRQTGDNELPPGVSPLSPDSLSIYFSEQGENGITFLPIRVDREGEFIDRWPHGFFNERMGEI